jgi:mono/diheme cytochrome c family protein
MAAALGMLALLLAACSTPWSGDTQFRMGRSEDLVVGERLYESNCAACHGIDGEGQPDWKLPDANGVYPAPPHTTDGHTWHHADPLLLDIIANGGTPPKSAMPGFEGQLNEAEMAAILAYIKTFWGKEERAYQELVTNQAMGNDD